jgi:hypothetical protein
MRLLKKAITLTITVALMLSGVFSFPSHSNASVYDNNFPKLANYYLDWDVTKLKIEKLARYDVVTLSNAAYFQYPNAVKELKQLNPDIVVLVYVVSNEVMDIGQTLPRGNFFRTQKEYVENANLYLETPQNERITYWPGTQYVNIHANNHQYAEWLASQVTQKYLNAGFDGVMYDNVFQTIDWVSSNVDINNDGARDTVDYVNARWREGAEYLIRRTKELNPNKIVVANTNGNYYNFLLHGRLFEKFPRPEEGGWVGSTQGYLNATILERPQTFIVASTNDNNTNATANLRHVRFNFATALLGNGFFSFSDGDQRHQSLWWYDEYEVFLGASLSDPVNILTNSSRIEPGVWRREFENGIVYLNSTSSPQTFNLGADYEKISGAQDPSHNNGALIRTLTLQPQDGIILQKRVTEIHNAPYLNGAFVKPFNKYGNETQRNGFFLFDRQVSGNSVVATFDLDGNGTYERIVADRQKITIYNSDTSVRNVIYPYGGSYTKGITFDVGDVNFDGKLDIVTGTGRGYAPLVKVFDLAGNQTAEMYAYAKNYTGGVNVALADLNGNGNKDIVVGAGYLGGPQVRIFNGQGRLVSGGFFAYHPTFRGGVNVAAGDIDGDGIDEIITGAGIGGSTHVRMFNGKTHPLNPGFFAFSETSRAGVQVFVADLDGDGKDEILASNPNPFN